LCRDARSRLGVIRGDGGDETIRPREKEKSDVSFTPKESPKP
jgi:hypothetical protein